MSTKIPINILVSTFKEGDMYIAYSLMLDLSTYAPTFEKAQQRFEEAVQIFFEELDKKGTTDEVLTNLGWEKVNNEWTPPLAVHNEVSSFMVPLASPYATA